MRWKRRKLVIFWHNSTFPYGTHILWLLYTEGRFPSSPCFQSWWCNKAEFSCQEWCQLQPSNSGSAGQGKPMNPRRKSEKPLEGQLLFSLKASLGYSWKKVPWSLGEDEKCSSLGLFRPCWNPHLRQYWKVLREGWQYVSVADSRILSLFWSILQCY